MTLVAVPTLADGVAGWATWLSFVGSATAGYVFPILGALGLACFAALQYGERRARVRGATVPQEAHREIGEAGQTERDLAQRRLLVRGLSTVYKDGLRWYGNAEASDWEPWQKRTWTLIFAALGRDEADRFLSDWTDGSQTLTGLDARLQHVADLARRVDSVAPLELRSDFDGEDWVSRR